jgi:hypothetical protein
LARARAAARSAWTCDSSSSSGSSSSSPGGGREQPAAASASAAQVSAAGAEQSALSASNSATSASNSATEAANSATEAQQAATEAQQAAGKTVNITNAIEFISTTFQGKIICSEFDNTDGISITGGLGGVTVSTIADIDLNGGTSSTLRSDTETNVNAPLINIESGIGLGGIINVGTGADSVFIEGGEIDIVGSAETTLRSPVQTNIKAPSIVLNSGLVGGGSIYIGSSLLDAVYIQGLPFVNFNVSSFSQW